MKSHSFTRKEHLKTKDAIKKVFDKGVPSRLKLINIYLLKRETGPCFNRAAFTIKRNLYNKKSVLRNRFRRILREAYRKTKHLLSGGYDIVILGVNLNRKVKSFEVEKEMAHVFKMVSKK